MACGWLMWDLRVWADDYGAADPYAVSAAHKYAVAQAVGYARFNGRGKLRLDMSKVLLRPGLWLQDK